MNRKQTKKVQAGIRRVTAMSGQARTVLLVLVCFLLGLGVGAFWYYRASLRPPAGAETSGSALSESTRLILHALQSPVEIRFYALLDPATTPESLRAYAERVDRLLAEYEREAGGKLTVSRQTAPSDAAAAAAAADGLKAFNREKGEACFLGATVSGNGQKETLARLSPEWEAALESDLSRAIARVNAAKPATHAPATAPEPPAAIVAEVKRAIPNLESVSLADATQTLRVAALKEYVAETEAMERAVKDAEARVEQARAGGSEAEQQAAVKQLQQVQTQHTEKLKQIAAHLQEQIAALEQLKRK
jgi:hypothetical protein